MRGSARGRIRASAAVIAATAAAATLVGIPHASADELLVESFTGASVSDAAAWSSGGSGGAEAGWPGGACLTAGADTSQSPVPGCGLDSPDSEGSGALRLNPNALAKAGFALHNEALPTSGGLDITFQQAQWGAGGYAADGIAFFLVDGATDLTHPGASGGGLGYSAGWDGGSNYGTGIDNGLLGIGIDKWGNFSAQGSTGSGCLAGTGPGSAGPGQTPNVVSVRGPGNGSAGYCWLGASGDLGTLLYGDNTRAGAAVEVHIVVDPSTDADPKVTVSLDGTQVLQIDEPAELLASTSFKFGFSASTGAVTDVHEVWNLNINSVIPVEPTTTSTEVTSTTTTDDTSTSTTTTTTTEPVPATPATPVEGAAVNYTG
ncbi:MAG: hypothetical protein R2701_00200 [Acidimicrobiales bacterium]